MNQDKSDQIGSRPIREHNDEQFDVVYLNSLRETYVVFILFAIFCLISITTCFVYGYPSHDTMDQPVPLVWGMPSWVFWGIVVPWLAVDIVAIWFCFFFMQADDLGEEQADDISRDVNESAGEDL